jgi:hypothetical protein
MPNSYHFDLGDSTNGPIGFCARITADSEEEALRILTDALPPEYRIDIDPEVDGVEYIAVYFNPDAIHVTDIDDEQDAGPDEDDEDEEDEEGEDETR